MAGGGYGRRSQGGGILGKVSLPEEASESGGPAPLVMHSRLWLVVTVAICAVACVYAFSVMITRPCLLPCTDQTIANNPTLGAQRRIALDGSDSSTEGRDVSTQSNCGTRLEKIVFGIAASSKLWGARKKYVREWWRPETMRGYVWLDTRVNGTWDVDVPPFRISANTSHFKYSRKKGNRAALRLSRIVTEMFRMGLKNVDWFVMGDDDTVFFPDNLVRVLSNFDPSQMHYIGSQSESHVQNTVFSYGMAYGGGGFAISYPLAKALAVTHDDCLNRYPELFGSDDRMHACITEIGVPITKNPGFHQFDIHGDPMGLLASHPLTPLLSVHHFDVMDSYFPKKSRLDSLKHLMKAARVEEASMLQQTITYAKRRRFSFSISAGYVVRVYKGFVPPRELEDVPLTFQSWYRSKNSTHFPFSVREIPNNPCQQPTLFFLSERTVIISPNTTSSRKLIETVYTKEHKPSQNLTGCDASLNHMEKIRVHSAPLSYAHFDQRRRLCGTTTTWGFNDTIIEIYVRPCEPGELVIGPD